MIAVSVLIAVLPQALKRLVLRRMYGWSIAPSAHVGISLFANVRAVSLGPNAHVGHFNVFRDLARLEVGPSAAIGQWNWITAAAVLVDAPHEGERGFLVLGPHSAITSRHYVDCTGGVTVGSHSVVAGVRSTILTHEVDVVASRQRTAGTTIGDYCFIGSDVRMTAGTHVPDECVVAMGAVVTGELPKRGVLYGGVPARALKEVGGDYFNRDTGYVD